MGFVYRVQDSDSDQTILRMEVPQKIAVFLSSIILGARVPGNLDKPQASPLTLRPHSGTLNPHFQTHGTWHFGLKFRVVRLQVQSNNHFPHQV